MGEDKREGIEVDVRCSCDRSRCTKIDVKKKIAKGQSNKRKQSRGLNGW